MAIHLNYSNQRRQRIRAPFIRRAAVCGLLFVAILVCYTCYPFLRTSADVRLDTGDIRIRYLGIPIEYLRMSEPARSQLLAIGAGSTILQSKWCHIATLPERDSNTIAKVHEWYYRATIWAAADPGLARLMLEDTVTGTANGLCGAYFLMNSFFEQNGSGRWTVKPDWRQDPEVLDYAASKGYSIPPPRVPKSKAAS